MNEVEVVNSHIKITPFAVERLHELKIVKAINEHVRLTFSGIVPESSRDSYVHMADAQTSIKVTDIDEQGNQVTLFHGMVLGVQILQANGVYTIRAEAVSHTYLWDAAPKDRSFQNKGLLYEQLAKQITGDYARAQVIDFASDGAALGNMVLQYRETDWQLLKRLASHFHTGLVPVAMDERALCYIGVPELGSKGKLSVYNYRVHKRMDLYHQAMRSRIPNVTEHDFVFYEAQSEQGLDIGHEVAFQNRKLVVNKVVLILEKSVLLRRYTLAPKGGLSLPKQYNTDIVGASIQGTVLAVSRDQLKVHLNMDSEQDERAACWFPYSTIYASADNAGFYCMPEQGDDIRIYFPTHKEKDALAMSSVPKPGPEAGGGAGATGGSGAAAGGSAAVGAAGGGDPMDNPEIKTIKTKNGKMIVLAPDQITITGEGVSIVLSDADGITIMSSKDVKVTAVENVTIQSKTLVIAASEKVEMTCKGSSLLIDEDIIMKGNQVRNN
ncbi:Phage late control gene D protein (GPD) [Paenibacillus algorifonticola]|uniref:Phage late control gene D protein (GPD) n=1 Tax=Paenibacillus algorifonticola TaxID=684063 RepID=A0A1I2CFC1_9BACL|nr:phage baseplate assembly protein V [Paenibacillus algorifonticola]SFE66380.1 Phage late control gene D protein (GPD) [Paenibacillus algorifonticola]